VTKADDLVQDYRGDTIVSTEFCCNLLLEISVKADLGHKNSPATVAREQACEAGGLPARGQASRAWHGAIISSAASPGSPHTPAHPHTATCIARAV
jgi:hypothetical protein